jgi:Protein of unknown function (DUF2934)
MARKTIETNIQELSPGQDISSPSDHDVRIAELAYIKAERRGFTPGHELEDWLEAEQEVFFTQGNDAPVVTGNFGFQVEA